MPPVCLDTLTYVWMTLCMFGWCLDVPYIDNTKKTCFVRLRGVHMSPYIWMPHMFGCTYCMFWCPHMFGHHPHFGCPFYVWMPPVCLETLYMFGCPPPCLDTPTCLDGPNILDAFTVCLDAPICLDAHLYVWIPPYVWMSSSMFVDPVWMDAPICLDASNTFGHSHMFGCPHPNTQGEAKHMEDTQTYRGCPNMWVCPTIQRGVPKIGGTQTYRDIQTYGECKNMGYVQTCR